MRRMNTRVAYAQDEYIPFKIGRSWRQDNSILLLNLEGKHWAVDASHWNPSTRWQMNVSCPPRPSVQWDDRLVFPRHGHWLDAARSCQWKSKAEFNFLIASPFLPPPCFYGTVVVAPAPTRMGSKQKQSKAALYADILTRKHTLQSQPFSLAISSQTMRTLVKFHAQQGQSVDHPISLVVARIVL